MKNLTKFLLPVLVLMVSLQSCNDVLDNAKPTTTITPKQALSTPGAIDGVRAGMYDDLHNYAYTTNYMLTPEILADNLFLRQGANRLSGPATNAQGSGVDTYAISYDIINIANQLINNIPDKVLGAGTKAQYRGEAYFMRAFAYHQLARTFGYAPGQTPNSGEGQGFELGVILRLTPTLQASDANYRPRSTETKVYQQIESDLKNAISLLSKQQASSVIYPTKAAAEAELARVYLYWRKWSNANKYAKMAITDANDMGVKLAQADQVASMFDETKGRNPEGIWILDLNATTTVGLNNSLRVYTSASYIADVPTQDVMDLYSSGDARLALFGPCFDDIAGAPKPGCISTNQNIANGNEQLELQKWNAEPGNYVDDIPYLRISELLLIESEARLHAGGDAATPLNKLRKARNLSPLASVNLQDILTSRRREFIGEGMRFFDLKRLGMDIRKAPGTGQQTLPYFDYRVLDNIPYSEVANSQAQAPKDSALVQNPGY